MALIVGTDAYVSLTESNTYWSNRNNTTWSSASDANKEKAIREATQYLDGAYEYVGELTDLEQSLAWPRSFSYIQSGNFKNAIFATDVIPQKIKDACCELALDALSARLMPSQDRAGLIKKQKVDVIEVEYMDYAPSQKTFDFVSLLLKGLTVGGKNNIKLGRCYNESFSLRGYGKRSPFVL